MSIIFFSSASYEDKSVLHLEDHVIWDRHYTLKVRCYTVSINTLELNRLPNTTRNSVYHLFTVKGTYTDNTASVFHSSGNLALTSVKNSIIKSQTKGLTPSRIFQHAPTIKRTSLLPQRARGRTKLTQRLTL